MASVTLLWLGTSPSCRTGGQQGGKADKPDKPAKADKPE